MSILIEVGQWAAILIMWVLSICLGVSVVAVLFDHRYEYDFPKILAFLGVILIFAWLGGALHI